MSNHGAIPSGRVVTFYRSVATMMGAGVPLFAIFEFLAREPEDPEIGFASQRIAQNLVRGQALHQAVSSERALFDPVSVKMLEIGYRSGKLCLILERLASQKESNWEMAAKIRSQLTYPLGIAVLTLVGVMLIPPLVLADLLEQVVALTSEPPLLTRWLLSFSSLVGSPVALGLLALLVMGGIWVVNQGHGQRLFELYEKSLWSIPVVGDFWKTVVSYRFLGMFALTYDCGLPITQCAILSAAATGSPTAELKGPAIKNSLIEGLGVRQALESADFLPQMALESVEAGEQSGTLPFLMERAAELLKAEVTSRMEMVTKFVEPMVLFCLGAFVAIFALGCLLPIIRLAETL